MKEILQESFFMRQAMHKMEILYMFMTYGH